MAVNEKQSSIAVLKTMGMGGLSLRLVFVLLGMINGFVGALFGCVLGTAFAFNLTDLATGIERLFDTRIIDGDVYFIDFLPSLVVIDDVITTFIIAILLSFLATLYPANKAANLSPARVLAH